MNLQELSGKRQNAAMIGPEALADFYHEHWEKLVHAIHDRDAEWMESLHPGNAGTTLGVNYGTPERYKDFQLAATELQNEIVEHWVKKCSRLKKKVRKLRARLH